MRLAHQSRANRYGVRWDLVDFNFVHLIYDGKCGICGLSVSKEEMTIDHIVPLSRGGPHVLSNLQPAHSSCNTKKGAR